MNKKKAVIINVIILLAILTANVIIWFFYSENKNCNSVYMKLEDDGDILERWFDFHNGSVYRYTTIVVNSPDQGEDNIEQQLQIAQKVCRNNMKKYSGMVADAWE